MDYAGFIDRVVTLMETQATAPDFVQILPGIIDDAEQRMYRELDLLSTVVIDNSQACEVNSRAVPLPMVGTNPKFITLQEANIVVPYPKVSPDFAQRIQLTPVSKEFINATYNSAAYTAVPVFFAMQDDTTVILGPWPDQAYQVEFVGTVRPVPLSVDNTTTFLTLYLPDAFLAAAMVFASGFQKNFGSQSDDPKMAVSWENTYKERMLSAGIEEARRKFWSSAWSSMSPPVAATPNRGS